MSGTPPQLLSVLLFLAPGPAPEILVSRHLLEDRGLSVGEEVQLSADPRGSGARSFRIVGVYEPTPDPTRFTARRLEARLHLPDLLTFTADPGDPHALEAVDAINIALKDPAQAPSFAQALGARTPTLTVAPARAGEVDRRLVVVDRFHEAIALVTVIGSSAFLLALMVIRADERREIAGILRLVGFSRRRVLAQALLEGCFIASAGSLFGVACAAAAEDLINVFFQWRYDTSLLFVRVTPAIALRCVARAVPLGVLAGLLASWTLLRRDVSALLRR